MPFAIAKEVRDSIAVYCLSMVFEKEAMTNAQKNLLIQQFYHGDEETNRVSHVGQFLGGKPPFKNCFKRMEVENNSSLNSFIWTAASSAVDGAITNSG